VEYKVLGNTGCKTTLISTENS